MRRREELRRARAAVRLPVSRAMAQGLLALSTLFMATLGAHAQAVNAPAAKSSNRPDDAGAVNKTAVRVPKAVARKPMDCRVQALRLDEQRASYGTGSPRNRQSLNDCTPLGATL